MKNGTLYVVGTPIGNLDDMTLRGVKILQSVDLILCEDTRVSGKLLSHFGIKKPLESLHAHSTPKKINKIIHRLTSGEVAGLMTDAGTPSISDPGSALIRVAWDAGLTIVPIPGVSALTTALSVSGFTDKDFVFKGFIPKKKGRETFLRGLKDNDSPIVFFESVHQIKKLISQLRDTLDPVRMLLIGREITKIHETIYRGKVGELTLDSLGSLKGEFVIIIDRA